MKMIAMFTPHVVYGRPLALICGLGGGGVRLRAEPGRGLYVFYLSSFILLSTDT